MRLNYRLIIAFLSAVFVVGCSTLSGLANTFSFNNSSEIAYLPAGQIIVSRPISEVRINSADDTKPMASGPEFSQLVGFFPPSKGFLPAQNQTWLEIDSKEKTVQIFRGQTSIRKIQAEGKVSLEPGTYSLQHKQKRPLWYAPDDYFAKRQLPVPPPGDRERYRRGALGQFALYPSVTFPIHSGPVWSDDVGGLRVSRSELSAIYYIVPIGTSVVVK